MKRFRKEYIIIAIAVLMSVAVLAGTTYAVFTKTVTGDEKLTIQTGTLEITFGEGDEINLSNTAPMSDERGQKTTPYTFSVKNTGTITAYYTVYIEEDSGNTLDNKYVKYRLISDDGFDTGIVNLTGGGPDYVIRTEEALAVDKTVNYTLYMWLDEATPNEMQGTIYKSRVRVDGRSNPSPNVADTILAGNTTYDDGTDTFITGEDPNNYIWYSGKLWRAVSVNNADKTTKLVTQWNISAISYNSSGNTAFDGSHMEMWLNDTSVDGFLGNLRDYEEFIVTDAKWNATQTTSSSKPAETTMVTDAVGLLNYYEYVTSYHGTTSSNGYLNNGLYWWMLTPYSSSIVRRVNYNGSVSNYNPDRTYGARPSINLKSSVTISGGDGTENNPYRLKGDNDSNLSGTLLNTRYSGEYISLGTGENNLYRIVSHETSGLTKITSAEPLKDSGTFKTLTFGSNTTFSSTNTVGSFLNGDYLTSGSYLTSDQANMITDSTIWYLGTVGSGANYRLAKYTNTSMTSTTTSTTAKVGLLRLGELMSGQFDRYAIKGGSSATGLTTAYWLLTPYSASNVRYVNNSGYVVNGSPDYAYGARPAFNLKSSVTITGGTGTKEDPFTISMGGPVCDPNGDGVVTQEDVTVLSNANLNGTLSSYYPQCDLNDDGEVNVLDIMELSRQAAS